MYKYIYLLSMILYPVGLKTAASSSDTQSPEKSGNYVSKTKTKLDGAVQIAYTKHPQQWQGIAAELTSDGSLLLLAHISGSKKKRHFIQYATEHLLTNVKKILDSSPEKIQDRSNQALANACIQTEKAYIDGPLRTKFKGDHSAAQAYFDKLAASSPVFVLAQAIDKDSHTYELHTTALGKSSLLRTLHPKNIVGSSLIDYAHGYLFPSSLLQTLYIDTSPIIMTQLESMSKEHTAKNFLNNMVRISRRSPSSKRSRRHKIPEDKTGRLALAYIPKEQLAQLFAAHSASRAIPSESFSSVSKSSFQAHDNG